MNTVPRLTIALICSASLCTVITGCTRPKQTTAIGAAAGTAIGAGLGAIIGNQTGNAGSGVAIGAVAGAATGALVGNVFQKQEESAHAQNESINRQEQMLRAQKSEISELRRMQSDTPASLTGTSTVNAYLVEQKRLQLQKRGPSPRGESVARYSPPPVRSSEPLARYDIKTVPAAPRTITPPLPKKVSVPVAPAPVIPAVEDSSPAKSAAPIQEKDLTEQLNPVAPVIEEATAKVDAAPESPAACDQSSKERAAATAASENSDKLYHLRRALRLCPQSAETHYELGKTYLAMDRAVDATYEFKQALTTDPSFKPAQKELDNLEQNKVKF